MFTGFSRRLVGPLALVVSASLLGCRGGGQTTQADASPGRTSIASPAGGQPFDRSYSDGQGTGPSRSYISYPTVRPALVPPTDDEARRSPQPSEKQRLKQDSEPRLLPGLLPATVIENEEYVDIPAGPGPTSSKPVVEPLESERRLAPASVGEQNIFQRLRGGITALKFPSPTWGSRDEAAQVQTEPSQRRWLRNPLSDRSSHQDYVPFGTEPNALIQTTGEVEVRKQAAPDNQKAKGLPLPTRLFNPVTLETPSFLGF